MNTPLKRSPAITMLSLIALLALTTTPLANAPLASASHTRGCNCVTATIPVGNEPHGIAVDVSTNMVYVANFFSNTLSVISGRNNTVVATIPVGSFPYGVDVNPTTNTIYVTNSGSGTVSVISGSNNAVTA